VENDEFFAFAKQNGITPLAKLSMENFLKKMYFTRTNAKRRRCECCCGILQHEIRN
jgi:hypothetical protein